MATFRETISNLLGGYIPIGGNDADPFGPFRNPTEIASPVIRNATGEDIVPMFKRPQRFKTPLLPVVGAYDADGLTAAEGPGAITQITGIQIVPQNLKRTGLIIRNAGYGTAYISSFTQVGRQDFPLPPLEDITIVPSSALNVSPTNAIYAVGEVGADLRILEIVFAPVGSEFTA